MAARWWFTAVLIASFAMLHHLWRFGSYRVNVGITLAAVALLAVAMAYAITADYFRTRVELAAHCLVLVDLVAHVLLARDHEGFAFYAIAAAFAVVLTAYRRRLLQIPRA